MLDLTIAALLGFTVGISSLGFQKLYESLPKRKLFEYLAKKDYLKGGARDEKTSAVVFKAVVWGAGALGDVVSRQMINCRSHHFELVGFIDDDPGKRGKFLNGVRVIGSTDDLEAIISEYEINVVALAIWNPRDKGTFQKNLEKVERVREKKNVHFLRDLPINYGKVEQYFLKAVPVTVSNVPPA